MVVEGFSQGCWELIRDGHFWLTETLCLKKENIYVPRCFFAEGFHYTCFVWCVCVPQKTQYPQTSMSSTRNAASTIRWSRSVLKQSCSHHSSLDVPSVFECGMLTNWTHWAVCSCTCHACTSQNSLCTETLKSGLRALCSFRCFTPLTFRYIFFHLTVSLR